MRGLRGRIRDLIGGNEARLVSSLLAQLDAASAGANVASDVATGRTQPGEARRVIGEIEHRGDRHRARLIDELGHALVTPFDREDLFRLSRSIDDVLDNLRDFVREYDLFGAPDGSRYASMLAAIDEGLDALADAVRNVLDRPAGITRGALAAKKVGNQVRQEYQVAIADLLGGHEVTTDLLKARELLRRLDVVGLRLGEAADALADGAMKRSH